MATYKSTMGSKRGGKSWISENDSAPSSLPQDVMVKSYPDVMSGGSMSDDSMEYSDRLSNARASGVKKQPAKTPY